MMDIIMRWQRREGKVVGMPLSVGSQGGSAKETQSEEVRDENMKAEDRAGQPILPSWDRQKGACTTTTWQAGTCMQDVTGNRQGRECEPKSSVPSRHVLPDVVRKDVFFCCFLLLLKLCELRSCEPASPVCCFHCRAMPAAACCRLLPPGLPPLRFSGSRLFTHHAIAAVRHHAAAGSSAAHKRRQRFSPFCFCRHAVKRQRPLPLSPEPPCCVVHSPVMPHNTRPCHAMPCCLLHAMPQVFLSHCGVASQAVSQEAVWERERMEMHMSPPALSPLHPSSSSHFMHALLESEVLFHAFCCCCCF